VADLTYLRCWEGVVFFAFIIDAYSRRIVGWQLAGHMRTTLVLDALKMALHQRGPGADVELVHSDRGSQYTSIDHTQTLADHGVLASVGSVGDAYDNALAESFVDSFKTELISDRVWRTRNQLELAVVEYLGWFNTARLHQALGDVPPAEFEALTPPRGETITSTIMSKEPQLTRSPRNPGRLIHGVVGARGIGTWLLPRCASTGTTRSPSTSQARTSRPVGRSTPTPSSRRSATAAESWSWATRAAGLRRRSCPRSAPQATGSSARRLRACSAVTFAGRRVSWE
jgi:hypothetical protein